MLVHASTIKDGIEFAAAPADRDIKKPSGSCLIPCRRQTWTRNVDEMNGSVL
jgi:hypothetical protein